MHTSKAMSSCTCSGGSNGDSLSHAVTTGTENNQHSEVTVVRNLFYDVDHALLSKDGGFITAVNNTVVRANLAAVNMYEARSGQSQGKGFYGDGNIFCDVAHVFANPDWAGHPTAITMNNSIFPVVDGDPVVWAGDGNLNDVDPQLLQDCEHHGPAEGHAAARRARRPSAPGPTAGTWEDSFRPGPRFPASRFRRDLADPCDADRGRAGYLCLQVSRQRRSVERRGAPARERTWPAIRSPCRPSN